MLAIARDGHDYDGQLGKQVLYEMCAARPLTESPIALALGGI